MAQSKKASLIEALVNQTIEWATMLVMIQALISFYTFMFGVYPQMMLPLGMFVVGVLRLYIVRRAGNWHANRTS